MDDEYWMRAALACAEEAALNGEVPVGAVCVYEDRIIARGCNQPIAACDPCAHAEIVALRAAGQVMQNYRLPGVTLYVSLEPCAMCAFAMVHARIDRLVFATEDPRTGAAGTVLDVTNDSRFNHQIEVTKGVLQAPAAKLLTNFFRQKRCQQKSVKKQ